MIYINITSFVPISEHEKYHIMIETRHLEKLVLFSKQFEVWPCNEKLGVSTTI